MIKRIGKFSSITSLLFRYSVLVVLGFALFSLWDFTELQHHESWGRFYAIWIPLMYAMFSTGYLILREWTSATEGKKLFYRLIARFGWYDEYTYFFPLAILAAILAGPLWENAFLWLSIGYLTLVLVKSALFLACLFLYLRRTSTLIKEKERVPRSLKMLLLLAAFVPYCLISAYHLQRISTTGDEPHYLLISHSLLHDRDTNLYNNYADKDYQHFYRHELRPTWGDRVSKTEVYSYRHKGGFPATLIPGYALGGRFGATLQMNLIAALLMLQVFLLSYEVFQALTASFTTWFCMTFSVPMIVYMGQIYPEPLAALLAVWVVRQIRLLGKSALKTRIFWLRSLFIGLACMLLVMLKTRYVPLAATLLLFWGWDIFQSRLQAKHKLRAVFGLLLMFVLGGVFVLFVDKFFLGGMFMDRITDRNFMAWMLKGYNPLYGVFGLLFDQEYGLLFYSPLYMLAFVGIGLLSRSEWRKPAPFIALFSLNYFVVAFWSLWHAAPTPPTRYILPVLPFLGIFMTKFFCCKGLFFVKRIALGVCGACSFLMAWSLTLNPWWRYNWADGTNNFLEMQSLRLTMNLTRLFPSFSRMSSMTVFGTMLGVLCIGIIVYACRIETRRKNTFPPKELLAEYSVIMILVLFLSLFSGGLVCGKILTSAVIEAEDKLDVERQGGERVPKSLDPWDNQIYLREWKYSAWKLMPGDSITLRPKLFHPLPFLRRRQKNEWEMQVYARALLDKNNPGVFPVLRVMLNGKDVEKVVVDTAVWKIYPVKIFSEKSRPTLTIVHEKTQGAEESGLVVDKLKFL
ncbi:MAG: hypothetical protein GY801_15125 [bacterium]|nr:hypothetical protein [bacterium]